MHTKILKKSEYLIPAIYLLTVLVGFFFAFPMERDNNGSFFFLVLMTLPWSIVTFFFIMFAIHQGFKNEAGFFFFTATAILNAFLLYLIMKSSNKK
jgi:ABC-type sugar transport system permease subunit